MSEGTTPKKFLSVQQDGQDHDDYYEQQYDSELDGGLRAWMVVAGGFLTYFSTFGLLSTFGAFQLYYEEVALPSYSPSAISWIGSLQLFIVLGGGYIIGTLYDSYGARAIAIPGSLIFVLSLMFTSLSTKYYQFLLAQGIIFGIGNAMSYYPSVSSISQWFNRRRGLCLGIVVSGASLGGICWPLIFNRLLSKVGFPWAVRIIGFICLGLLGPACWLVVERKVRVSGYQNGPPRPKLDVIATLKDAGYGIFIVGVFLVQWGMYIPLFYIATYGKHYGMSKDEAYNLVSYLNAGAFVSSIVVGFTADNLGRFNVMLSCSLSCGILLYCLYAVKSYGAIIAFSALYGFCFGGMLSLPFACAAQVTPDIRIIGAKLGILTSISSFGNLTGNPIAGALIAKYNGEFGGLINFGATVLVGGAILVLCSRMVAAPKQWIF